MKWKEGCGFFKQIKKSWLKAIKEGNIGGTFKIEAIEILWNRAAKTYFMFYFLFINLSCTFMTAAKNISVVLSNKHRDGDLILFFE